MRLRYSIACRTLNRNLKLLNGDMMSRIFITYFALFLLPYSSMAKQLTVERIYSSPSIDGGSIQSLKISPDGSRATFLRGKEDDY